MEQFIWYSVSGAFIVASFLIGWRCSPLEGADVAISIAATPIVGFVFHQIYRVQFERCSLYIVHREKLELVWRGLALHVGFQNRPERGALRIAYLIWIMTLFGRESLRPFRDRHVRAWRFFMACKTGSWSAFAAALIMLGAGVNVLRPVISIDCHGSYNFLLRAATWLVLFLATGIVLKEKARVSREMANKEDIGFLWVQSDTFYETARRLATLDGRAPLPSPAWYDSLLIAARDCVRWLRSKLGDNK